MTGSEQGSRRYQDLVYEYHALQGAAEINGGTGTTDITTHPLETRDRRGREDK